MGVDWVVAEHDKLPKVIDALTKSADELEGIGGTDDFEFNDIQTEEAKTTRSRPAPRSKMPRS